jgi:hypothetical protein
MNNKSKLLIFLCSFIDCHTSFSRVPVVPSSYSSILLEIVEKQASGGLTWKPEKNSSAGNDVTNFDNDDDFLGGGEQRVFDPSVEMYPHPYCSIVDTFAETCFEDSILELFGREGKLDAATFDNLTTRSIIDRINRDMIR